MAMPDLTRECLATKPSINTTTSTVQVYMPYRGKHKSTKLLDHLSNGEISTTYSSTNAAKVPKNSLFDVIKDFTQN